MFEFKSCCITREFVKNNLAKSMIDVENQLNTFEGEPLSNLNIRDWS